LRISIDINPKYRVTYSEVALKHSEENRKDGWDRLIEIYHEDHVLRTFILLVQTTRVVAKYIDSYLFRKLGISQVKFIVLMAFYANPYKQTDTVTVSDIARWTDTETHNITTLIKRMKKDGLLSAERDEIDHRFVKITITSKGEELVRRNMPVAQEIVNQVMSSISQKDILQLESLLKVIRQNAYDGLGHLPKSP
jgi:DNA-binding MarR family transcriptional regulator